MQNNTITSNNHLNDTNLNTSTTKRAVGRLTRLGIAGAVATTIGLFAAATPASASTCSAAQDPGFLGGVYVAAGDFDADGDVDGRDFLVWQRSTGAVGEATTSGTYFVVDSFSFGVEREMKESGEKGGTADINIGVGELQEVSISKSMDMASIQLTQFAINGILPNLVDVEQGDEASTGQPICYLQYKLDR